MASRTAAGCEPVMVNDLFLTFRPCDLGSGCLLPTSSMMALAAALLKTGEAMELCSELEGPLPDPTDPVLRLAPPPPTNGGLLSLLGEL